MTDNISNTNSVTTESEIGSNGVGHSKANSSVGGVNPSSELVESLERTIKSLSDRLESIERSKSESSVDKLTEAIERLANNNKPKVAENNHVNSSKDFSQRTLLDGEGMMAAQSSLLEFQHEATIPISIPKTFVNSFGPSLAVSVNGVRVSIPCDGKTYFINETHAIAAKERIAKVDRLLADTEAQIIETNA